MIRLRSHPSDKVVLNDLDREVINRTFGACRAITQISKYMTRTVRPVHPFHPLVSRLFHPITVSVWKTDWKLAPEIIGTIVVDLGPNFLSGGFDGGTSYLVWSTHGS